MQLTLSHLCDIMRDYLSTNLMQSEGAQQLHNNMAGFTHSFVFFIGKHWYITCMPTTEGTFGGTEVHVLLKGNTGTEVRKWYSITRDVLWGRHQQINLRICYWSTGGCSTCIYQKKQEKVKTDWKQDSTIYREFVIILANMHQFLSKYSNMTFVNISLTFQCLKVADKCLFMQILMRFVLDYITFTKKT